MHLAATRPQRNARLNSSCRYTAPTRNLSSFISCFVSMPLLILSPTPTVGTPEPTAATHSDRGGLRNLDEVVIKRRAVAEVGQRLRDGLIDIAMAGAELVPPRRKCAGDARLNAVGKARDQQAFTAIIPHAHGVAVADAARFGVRRIDEHERLLLALEERGEMREGR